MIVYGNIAQPLEKRTARESQKDYYLFRLAENQGREENRTTTWYDVVAFISEIEADMLNKGMLVKVMGAIKGEAFKRKNSEELGVALRITAFKVEPYEHKPRQQSEDGQGQHHTEG